MAIQAPAPYRPGLRDEDPPMPFSQHLVELRERLIWSLIIVACGTALAYNFAQPFLDWLARPVGSLVFIAPEEAFETRLKLSFYGGFLLTLPLLLHQVWLFVARAFSKAWRRRLLTMLPLSYALFMGGVFLCLCMVVPAAVKFFLAFGSEGVKPLITLKEYLRFVTTLSIAFGSVFQFPMVLYTLNWMGLLSKAAVKPHRRLVYFVSFVIPAFFTPDIVSQCSLAGCIMVLFELTLLAMK